MLTMNYQTYNQQYAAQVPQQGGQQQPGFQQPGVGQNWQQPGMQNTQYQQQQQLHCPPQYYWQGHAQQPQQYMQQAQCQPNTQYYQQPQMQGNAAPHNQWAFLQQQQQQITPQQYQAMHQQQYSSSSSVSLVNGTMQKPVNGSGSQWNGTCIQITNEPIASTPDSRGTVDTKQQPSPDPPGSPIESSATNVNTQEAIRIAHPQRGRKLSRGKRGPRKGVSHADLKQVVMSANGQSPNDSAASHRDHVPTTRRNVTESDLRARVVPQADRVAAPAEAIKVVQEHPVSRRKGPRRGVSNADLKQVVETVRQSPKSSDKMAPAVPRKSSTQADLSNRVSRAHRLAAYEAAQGGTSTCVGQDINSSIGLVSSTASADVVTTRTRPFKTSTSPSLLAAQRLDTSSPVSVNTVRFRSTSAKELGSHPLYSFSDDEDE